MRGNDVLYKRAVLYQQDKLLDLRNDDLDNQLVKLQNVQSSIINKDRIIDQLNENIYDNNNMIFFLNVLVVFSIILFFLIILYGQKTISGNFLGSMLFLFVFIMIVVYLYSFNIFKFKDGFNFTKQNRNEIILSSLDKWDKEISDYVHFDKSKNKKWESKNCDCTVMEEEGEGGFASIYDPKKVPIKGYFYFDGNDPQQLLVPSPQKDIYKDNRNDNIDWVDYSEDSKKNYYDYPNDDLKNKLNESTKLVDNKTYSANF